MEDFQHVLSRYLARLNQCKEECLVGHDRLLQAQLAEQRPDARLLVPHERPQPWVLLKCLLVVILYEECLNEKVLNGLEVSERVRWFNWRRRWEDLRALVVLASALLEEDLAEDLLFLLV